LAAQDLGFDVTKSKIADHSEATKGELIIPMKEALKREKSKFEVRISNVHKLMDLDSTFQELKKSGLIGCEREVW